jgi:SAM-dependent methyltransferase
VGFDVHALTFILEAGRGGVSFEDCLTLGRQGLAVTPRQMKTAFRRAGLPLGDEAAARLLANAEGGRAGYAETFLRRCGANRITSLDCRDHEGATLIHDLNVPVPDTMVSRYSCVIDSGTLEHIFNVPVALASCMRMVRPGGHFLIVTPANNQMGHGFYQFSPELFWTILSEPYGFAVERLFVCETQAGARRYAVANPASLGARVTLRNRHETILLVQARKLREERLDVLAPRQSDYAVIWARGASQAAPLPPGVTRATGALRSVLPEPIKRVLRPILQSAVERVMGPYRPPFYRKDR